jgi:hypothetical protein
MGDDGQTGWDAAAVARRRMEFGAAATAELETAAATLAALRVADEPPARRGVAVRCLELVRRDATALGCDDVATLCHAVQSGLLRTDSSPRERLAALDDASSAIEVLLRMVSGLGREAAGAATAVEPPEPRHIDGNVYRFAVLESLRSAGAGEAAWVAARLAAAALNPTPNSSFALELMDLLRGTRLGWRTDRVCLAAVTPGSNQLMVVDSIVSERAGENAMARGYRCFVDPAGSLFRLRPGMVRVFDDAERVKRSFERQARPVQRSVARLVKMGLRSGLCLALGRGEALHGLLFLNSCEAGVFTEPAGEGALLLGLIAAAARTALGDAGFGSAEEEVVTGGYGTAERFDARGLATLMEASWRERFDAGGRFEVQDSLDEGTLVLARAAAGAVVELVASGSTADWTEGGRVVMRAVRAGPEVRLELPFRGGPGRAAWLARQAGRVHGLVRRTGLRVMAEADRAVVAFPFEAIDPRCGELPYSVESASAKWPSEGGEISA